MWQKNVLAPNRMTNTENEVWRNKIYHLIITIQRENGSREHKESSKIISSGFKQHMTEIILQTTLAFLVLISCSPRISWFSFPFSLIPGSCRQQKYLRRQIGKINAIKWAYFPRLACSLPPSPHCSLEVRILRKPHDLLQHLLHLSLIIK